MSTGRCLACRKWDLPRVDQIRMVLIHKARKMAWNLIFFVHSLNIHLLIGVEMNVNETYRVSSRIAVHQLRKRKYIGDWIVFSSHDAQYANVRACKHPGPCTGPELSGKWLRPWNALDTDIQRPLFGYCDEMCFMQDHHKMVKMPECVIPVFARQCATSDSEPGWPVLHYTEHAG